jgi:MYND finger
LFPSGYNIMTEDSYCRLTLPNGTKANVMTPAGADAVLTYRAAAPGEGPSDLVAANMNHVRELRQGIRLCRSNANNAAAADQMKALYVVLGFVADYASPEVFAANVDEVLMKGYLDHALEVLKDISRSRMWEQTGCLPTPYDEEMVDSLGCFCKHKTFVQLHIQKKMMRCLADMCAKVAPPRLVSPTFAQYVLRFVNNTNISQEFSLDVATEKSYRSIESSGMLLQVLRLVSIPQKDYQPHRIILDKLQSCPVLLKTFLSPDSPGRKALDDVLMGRNGCPSVVDEQIRKRLVAMTRVADLATLRPTGLDTRCCHNCSKGSLDLGMNVKMSVCSRCKITYYCTKDCQVADWKNHRKFCGTAQKPTKTSEQMVSAYLQKFYYEILKALYAATQERSVPKSQLILDLDFHPRIGHEDDSSSPALRGEFKVAVTKDYVDGKDSPAWFANCDEASKRHFLTTINDQCKRDLITHVLVICRHAAGGGGGVFRVQLTNPTTMKSLFADDLVTAFGERDWATVGQYLDDEMIQLLRHKLMREDMSSEDEHDLDNLFRRVAAFRASPRWEALRRQVEEDDDESDDDGA